MTCRSTGPRSLQPVPGRRAAILAALCAALAACSGGGGSSSPAPVPPPPPLSTAGLACTGAEGAGWCWQRPLPSGARHRALRFADARIGWMVLETGRLLQTTDGGATWRLQEVGTRSDLADAVYLDARRGWATEVFDRPFFKRFTTRLWATADGGQTWQRSADVPMEAVGSLRAFPPQTLVAFGLGNARFGVGATAVSEDGGQSWRVVRELDNVRSPLLTEGGVFVVPGLGRSTDHGRTWVPLPADAALSPAAALDGARLWGLLRTGGDADTPATYDLTRSDDQGLTWQRTPMTWESPGVGWTFEPWALFADGQGFGLAFLPGSPDLLTPASFRVLRTDDGGSRWRLMGMPDGFDGNTIGGLAAYDGQVALLLQQGTAFRTADGGATWRPAALPAGYASASSIRRDAAGGWSMVANGATLLRSVDRGATWAPMPRALPLDAPVAALWFSDAQRGRAWLSDGRAFDSADGGNTWTPRGGTPVLAGVQPGSLQVQAGEAWLVDGGGILQRTADAGISWAPLQPRAADAATTVRVAWTQRRDARNGLAVVSRCPRGGDPTQCRNELAVTGDGGATWSLSWEGGINDGQQVVFIDAVRGTRIDLGGRPWWTADGGLTWQAAAGAGDARCAVPRRGPADSLWCASGSTQLLRSLDAGRTWSVIELPVADPEQPVRTADMAWPDDRTGYVVAARDVYVTRDGGATWQQQPAPASGLRIVHALDADRAWIGGEQGVVLATVTGGRAVRP